ncbi:MAG: SH3 domain-containing protein [Hyphomicrobiales bacterium]
MAGKTYLPNGGLSKKPDGKDCTRSGVQNCHNQKNKTGNMSRVFRFALVSILFLGITAAIYAAAEFRPHGGGSSAATPNTTSSMASQTRISRYSGLPIPRFVSLKTSRVNVRRGPSRKHPIAWSYTKKGLPVEVISESDNWRQVRDVEGGEGWIYQGLLSGERSVVIAPWDGEAMREIRTRPGAGSAVVAKLEAGVVAEVRSCTGSWCEVESAGYEGWIAQGEVWGVYPGELVD